jgi:cell wall-associated NlpC family hydrolase
MISRTSLAAVSLASLVPFHAAASDAVDLAARQIGKPYVWGAEGPDSFDCSGLTQYVYAQAGLDLPRRAISQSRIGEIAGGDLQRGDLVFFSTDTHRTEVTHVGIYEGAGMMIDASKRNGRVRRDDLSDSFWTDRFMFARRVAFLVAGSRGTEGRDGPSTRPGSSSRIDRRKIATAVIDGIAGVLLRRPRN